MLAADLPWPRQSIFQRAASEGGTLGGQRAVVIAEERATLLGVTALEDGFERALEGTGP